MTTSEDMQKQINGLKDGLSRVELRQVEFDGSFKSMNDTLRRIDKHLEEIVKDLKEHIPQVRENTKWIGFFQKSIFWVATSVICAGLGRIVWGMVENGLTGG